jgi:hypothetical protein
MTILDSVNDSGDYAISNKVTTLILTSDNIVYFLAKLHFVCTKLKHFLAKSI